LGSRSFGCLGALEHLGDSLQLLDGFGSFQFHQFMAIAGFHPADAEIGNQKPNHVIRVEVGDEGGPVTIPAITAHIASGSNASALKAFGESLKTHHQVVNHRSVLLG
jgi:hypothetical protein